MAVEKKSGKKTEKYVPFMTFDDLLDCFKIECVEDETESTKFSPCDLEKNLF